MAKITKDAKQVTEDDLVTANVREVIKSGAGRKVLYHILDICNLYGESFTGNSQTFFIEGKRSIGLQVLGLIQEADPKAYPKLLLEMQEVD